MSIIKVSSRLRSCENVVATIIYKLNFFLPYLYKIYFSKCLCYLFLLFGTVIIGMVIVIPLWKDEKIRELQNEKCYYVVCSNLFITIFVLSY